MGTNEALIQQQNQIREEVTRSVMDLNAIHDNGKRDPDGWRKGILILSHRLAVYGLLQDVKHIFAVLPRSYIDDVLPRQMQEDQAFADLMFEICSKMLAAGIVVIQLQQADLRPTQAMGQA
jgi:hypothetical protein